MASLNISLPLSMEKWVNAQTETGRYSNASDYVRDLIRRDQERAEQHERLQSLIDEGLASGASAKSKAEIPDIARRSAADQDTNN